MSDNTHLQASDALLMQATFFASALKKEVALREGQAQLLEQLKRQLTSNDDREKLLDAAKQVLAARGFDDAMELAVEVLAGVIAEVEHG